MRFRPKLCLLNFEDCVFTDDWTEQSDTIWPSGKSTGKIAVRVLSMKRPSGRFDSNLIPQEPSGACFSGVSTKTNWDLDGYEYITFPCKGLGNATSYKIILGNSHPHRPDTTYEHSFKVCLHPKNKNNKKTRKPRLTMLYTFVRRLKLNQKSLYSCHWTTLYQMTKKRV